MKMPERNPRRLTVFKTTTTATTSKTIGFMNKTTAHHVFYEQNNVHHAFWYISLFFDVHILDKGVKLPNAKFYGGREHTRTNFSFVF